MAEMNPFRFFKPKHNLNSNRWQPEIDELAVYFNSRDLSGVFTKTLRVPSGSVARVLMDNQVLMLEEGEHNMETLWQRMNSFFQGRHGEVLITRHAALAVPFEFAGIHSADLLDVQVSMRLMVQVGDVPAFRNHFMRRPGAVTVAQLQDLLGPAVRQIVSEFINARPLRELQADMARLRGELTTRIDSGLRKHFAEYGLNFQGAETLVLDHEKNHSEQEWEEIARQEEALRQRYRQGKLKQEEAERIQELRARELDLLQLIENAGTREEAIRRGARAAVEDLEHDYAQKRRQREKEILKDRWQADDEATDWRHLQELARIRHEGELRAATEARDAAEAIERERIRNDLEKMRIRAGLEQAGLIEDEARRLAEMQVQVELLAKATLREEGLKEAIHLAQRDAIVLAAEIHRQEASRVRVWEDALLEDRIAAMQATRAVEKAETNLAGLVGLVKLDWADEDAKLRRSLKGERKRARIASKTADCDLERELKRSKDKREADRERREHEIQKATVFGALPPETLLMLAESPDKVDALLKITLTRSHAGMSPEQINASQASRSPAQTAAGAANGLSTQQITEALTGALNPMIKQMLDNKQVDERQQWDRFERIHEGTVDALTEMGNKIRDAATGVANAAGRQPAPPVAVPLPQPAYPQPAIQPVMPAAASAFKNCPQCRTINSVPANYCLSCGHALSYSN
jgi:hypothetical protein